MEKIKLDSIDSYNRLYGLAPQHPLVSVVDLKTATRAVGSISVTYGLYALFLKNGVACSLKYGRKSYDYQEGTIVSFAPGQVVDVVTDKIVVAPDVVGILFHPDLIYGTPLAEKIGDFQFFDYSQNEALHLSLDERAKFLDCLAKIREEIDRPVDRHSATLLAANIQVLLEYMHRFYDRQFITRHKVNSDIVQQFERRLKDYYRGNDVAELPSVAYFAECANLTPGYFGDVIKKETGTSAKDLITLHIVARAKHLLASTNEDVSRIAYSLGFDYPAHFSRMFKRASGMTPGEYRRTV